jgi:mitofusin
VSEPLSEEIRHLSVLVKEFNFPFIPKQAVLNVYKKELNHRVENRLGSNLRARLSTALAKDFEKIQREMTGNKWYAFHIRYFILPVG